MSYVRSKDNALELSSRNIGVRVEARDPSERLSCSLPRRCLKDLDGGHQGSQTQESIDLKQTSRVGPKCAPPMSLIVYSPDKRQEGITQSKSSSRKTTLLMTLTGSQRGAEISERKTTPTSNKTTQTPSTNPDLRTVKSSTSSIRHVHQTDRPCTPHSTLADR